MAMVNNTYTTFNPEHHWWTFNNGQWGIGDNDVTVYVTAVDAAYGAQTASVTFMAEIPETEETKKDTIIKKRDDDYYNSRFEILDFE